MRGPGRQGCRSLDTTTHSCDPRRFPPWGTVPRPLRVLTRRDRPGSAGGHLTTHPELADLISREVYAIARPSVPSSRAEGLGNTGKDRGAAETVGGVLLGTGWTCSTCKAVYIGSAPKAGYAERAARCGMDGAAGDGEGFTAP